VQGTRKADVVIHVAYVREPNFDPADHTAVDAMLATLEGSGAPIVYSSGTPVYGDTGNQVVDETAPHNPPPFLIGRVEGERKIAQAKEKDIRGIVIRPSLVYGRSGGSIAMLIEGLCCKKEEEKKLRMDSPCGLV